MEEFLEIKTWKIYRNEPLNALFQGDLAILRCDSRDEKRVAYDSERLNSLLGTNIQWHCYETVPHLNERLCVLFLLIYRILHPGMHIVLYMHALMWYLDPETMISTIDISSKGPRKTPMQVFNRFNEDTLYHFVNSSGFEFEHDTGLLDRIGVDLRADVYPCIGYIPRKTTTVDDILQFAGNFPTMVTVHDYEECMEAAASVPPDENNTALKWRSGFPKMLEAIVSPELRDEKIAAGYTNIPMTTEKSKYGDRHVHLYKLCCTPTQDQLCYSGIGDVYLDYEQICLALLVDLRYRRTE